MRLRGYFCKILKVIDGDTVVCEIDLGFNIFKTDHIRLNGIDAPEIREGEHALEAKKYLEQYLNQTLIIFTAKSDKFGRYLGEFYKEILDKKSINQEMIEKGLAKEYHGGKR